MYAPYISRYIFRRNVSRSAFQTHFPVRNATGMRFHGVRGHFRKKNGTIPGSGTRFRFRSPRNESESALPVVS